jgi:type I restriction enzyme, S subunit
VALPARLTAPHADRHDWPWHDAKWSEVLASAIWAGERRFEASTYLVDGYGIRAAVEARSGWVRMDEVAHVWQPPRTKATLVSPDHGTPFLVASQVFQYRPQARKWLSLEKLAHAQRMFVKSGDILVRRSADVGKSTIAFSQHEGHLVSDHLFRVEPLDENLRGWLYAYLRAPQTRAMMTAARYGHIIKHLEVSHFNALPIPVLPNGVMADFGGKLTALLALRERAHALVEEAEGIFASGVGMTATVSPSNGFSVRAAELSGARRRFEATYHSPVVSAILQRFADLRLDVVPLGDVTERVWWMTRFKRVFGEEGTPYMSADELFSLNARVTKHVVIEQAERPDDYFVKAGWIMMACSGQVYGLNGSVSLMTEKHERAFFSHDLVRIVPRLEVIRPGYLLMTLGHPQLGRPLVIRCAYGTSIPHLDPADIVTVPVVRLGEKLENDIADRVEEASRLRAQADELENDLASAADLVIRGFMAGQLVSVDLSSAARPDHDAPAPDFNR